MSSLEPIKRALSRILLTLIALSNLYYILIKNNIDWISLILFILLVLLTISFLTTYLAELIQFLDRINELLKKNERRKEK